MRYSESGQFITDGGAIDRWFCRSYRANAAGRPGVSPTSVGLPHGWGLISPLFARAFTLSSKITLVCVPGEVHSAVPWIEKSTVALAGAASPNLESILANKFVSWGFYSSGAAGTGNVKRRMSCSTKKWFAVKDVTDDAGLAQDIPLTGTVPDPPEREVFYNTGWTTTHDTVIQTGNIDFFVIIDYVVLFCEPRNTA